MVEESYIMVCAACGGIEVVTNADEGDAWLNVTKTIGRHRMHNRACQGAQQWVGTDLQECPYPHAAAEGPVN